MAKPHPTHRHQQAVHTINSDLKISAQGVGFLKSWEGFRAGLYDNDGAGQCTIGWGHLVHKGLCNGGAAEGPFKKGVTKEVATGLLMSDLSNAEAAVRSSVGVKLTQAEYDSLVSFTFNEGVGNFHTSTLLRYLNAGKKELVHAQFQRWVYAAGQVSAGLKRRRAAEATMFSSGLYQNNAAPAPKHHNGK